MNKFLRSSAKTSCGHTSYDLTETSSWVEDAVMYWTPQEGRVLDLGCGPGRHLDTIHGLGMEVYGLDLSVSYLKRSEERPSSGLVLADMVSLPFRDESFDTILAWRSIYMQKLEGIVITVAEIKRVLKPGGILICSCRSKTNTLYFIAQEIGEEVEPGTFNLDDGKDFFNVCYHFFALDEIWEIFRSFHIETTIEIPLKHTNCTSSRPEHQNTFWVIAARK